MDLFPQPSFGVQYKIANSVAFGGAKNTEPAIDNRYPAYAAQMQDGRLVTDYRNHCSRNVPAGAQFSTKKWMIHHAEEIMNKSRERQAEWTGAALGTANTMPPPAEVAHSTPFYNEIMPTGAYGGIGVERADAKAPALFGTFTVAPTSAELAYNKKNIGITTSYQGGRNSLRGAAVSSMRLSYD
jgi:hypothetical protein